MPIGWEWDETLFLGSAPFYERGRLPYAPGLAEAFGAALDLDGHGRLIDVGCGPGIITLTLAPLFATVTGVDPDPGMLAEGARRAAAAGIANITWHQALAEDLPGSLGPVPPVHVATFAQSLHWMDRPRVAAIMRGMLVPGGAFVQVSDVKGPVDLAGRFLPYPAPPYDAVEELVRVYLGPVRRAGQGFLSHGTPGKEEDVLRDAGYDPPQRIRVPAGPPLVRTVDDIVAWTWSLSGSAPHLFAERGPAFEADLRRMLEEAADAGRFSEQPPDTDIIIWRSPGPIS
jgi:SAM-dependent methyltransferase